jgi:hypothetical protein
MKLGARRLPFSFIVTAALGLSCDIQEPSAPLATLALDRRGNEGASTCGHSRGNRSAPVALVCVIAVPGNPITSSAKGWVEQQTGTYFLSDASNSGVDVIDIRTHTWVGRVSGFAGAAAAGGGSATTNGPGPSSFVSAPRRGERGDGDDDDHGHRGREATSRRLWVSDGNSTVQVVDPDRMQIVASVSTAIPVCDGGTATSHYCGRTNEIGYDPEHHIILVSNPSPLAVAAPHAVSDPYATFISAEYPYKLLGHITFPAAGNSEGHVWVPELRRFLLPVQPRAADAGTRGSMYIAVINPKSMLIEDKRVYYCPDIIGTTSTTNNNLQLGSNHHLLAQLCGRPVIMDVRTGQIIKVITKVGTGDQDWYNPGDGNFYVFGADSATGVPSLGVIDARRATWLQNVPLVLGASPAAFAKTNEIFARVQVNAGIVANPTTDNSACSVFGVTGRGCILVLAHTGGREKGEEEDGERNEK